MNIQPELSLAWPYIHAELKKQLDLNTSTIMREMSAPAAPDPAVIQNLAAERRVLLRQIRRFRTICGDIVPPADIVGPAKPLAIWPDQS